MLVQYLLACNIKRCTKEFVEKADHPCNFSNYVMTFVNSESPMVDGIEGWPQGSVVRFPVPAN